MANNWRKKGSKPNPFLTQQAQESAEQTLDEISRVNPEFTKHRTQVGPTHNPYVDSSLHEAQNKYSPDANSRYLAEHGVERTNPYRDHQQSNGHPNGHSNGSYSHSNGSIRSNQEVANAHGQYPRGRLSDLQNDSSKLTTTVKDDNPYHPANFYTDSEDRKVATELVQNHRKYPKAVVPKKHKKQKGRSRKKQPEPQAQNQPEVPDMDDLEAFFQAVELDDPPNQVHPVHYDDDPISDQDSGRESGQDSDHSDSQSDHFRQFMADPDAAATPLSPQSSSAGDCIQGCERITPGNFGSLRPGDVVSILMENLWTYYKVVSNERNGDDHVAKFESGFGSTEESVYIKGGVISKYLTVWGEQTESEINICREIVDDDKEEDKLDVVENGWIKLEDDGKLHLVVAYEQSAGVALLKAMGSNKERTADLSKCAFKVL